VIRAWLGESSARSGQRSSSIEERSRQGEGDVSGPYCRRPPSLQISAVRRDRTTGDEQGGWLSEMSRGSLVLLLDATANTCPLLLCTRCFCPSSPTVVLTPAAAPEFACRCGQRWELAPYAATRQTRNFLLVECIA
jgi:hypothetical protein